jgi:lipoyl(octanoyl) transferase
VDKLISQPAVDLPHSNLDWGLTQYTDAYSRQLQLVKKRCDGEIPDTLIHTEHHPVITIGARIGASKHLLWDEQTLRARGIEVVKSNRGGDITYHGPGQLVSYPIISLNDREKDLHLYLRDLEQVVINALGKLGLAAMRREGKTGIWLKQRKIAAIGVAVKHWVTYHGFAININNCLDPFEGIIPCGIEDATVTSMKNELGIEIDLNDVKNSVGIEFWKQFGNI